ncbi:non-ribosomal peptide synthetase [Solibacillus merdavium]|uniref:Amino acid adenylation domain-containing protein n=1 Tax=Solibacillus merdavium TaxID=2762218 RepID=A0ABR8XM80_9BACL|nr:non-ribosomal peptide synthetase [Solibacillus merdavium]MBD8033049.1 amino acid adenylation domain-containing protein [Solibacillus merdavium]
MNKSVQNIYSLTPLQEGVLYEIQMNSSQENLYISQVEVKINGLLDIDVLSEVWEKVVERHDALRTKIFCKGVENNVQVVFKEIDYELPYIDLTRVPLVKQHDVKDQKKRESMNIGIHNEKLMNVQVFKMREDEHYFVWTHHHILLDGWSSSNVLNEIFEGYNAIKMGVELSWQKPTCQFGDYIRYIRKTNDEEMNKVWSKLLKDVEQPTLSFNKKQSNLSQDNCVLYWEFSHNESKELRSLAVKHQTTLNNVLQLAWALLLKVWSGKDQSVFGIISSGRTPQLINSEKIVGLLINTIPMVVQFKEGDTLSDTLKNTQSTFNEILDYAHCPLVELKKKTQLQSDEKLFETLFVFENFPEAKGKNHSPIEWHVTNGTESHSYPISLQVQEIEGELRCKLVYDPHFIHKSLAVSVQNMFTNIAIQIPSIHSINELDVNVNNLTLPTQESEKNIAELKEISWNSRSLHSPLKEIWKDFFPGREPQGSDNFFELGGHSITAMKFVATVNKKLEKELTLKDLFESKNLQVLNELLFPKADISLSHVNSIIEKAYKDVLGLEYIKYDADFFELGGHSILAMKLLGKLNKEFSGKIELKAIYQHRTIELLSRYVESLKVEQQMPYIESEEVQRYRLSSNQESLWFNEKLTGKSTDYNIPQKYNIHGQLNIEKLESALNKVSERHEILKCVIKEEKGVGYQSIQPNLLHTIKTVDLVNLSDDEQKSMLQQIENEMRAETFDLESGPLLTVKLAIISETQYILFLNIHHLIFDGWSTEIFFNEWLSFYEDEMMGKRSFKPEKVPQYKDFVYKQQKWLEESYEKDIQFWKDHLSGDLPKLNLPYDTLTPQTKNNGGRSFIVKLDKENLERLKAVAMDHHSTLFISLLTMYQSFLANYTGQHDIIVGSSLANRMIPGTEQMIGYFINTLPFRLTLNKQETFTEILKKNTKHVIDIYDRQQMPLEKIVDAINPERNSKGSSLFETVFVLQNNEQALFSNQFMKVKPEILLSNIAKFDLSLVTEEHEQELLLAFEYNTSVFQEKTVRHLAENFIDWVRKNIANPQQELCSVPILNSQQQEKLLKEWQGKSENFEGENDTIAEAFYKIAEQYPGNKAVVDKEQFITFSELNKKSNQLARYLINQGLQSEEKVGIYMNRSIDMVISMLAVIKAGGAYVPLDPNYPTNRLVYIAQDASLTYCLTQIELKEDEWIQDLNLICTSDWPLTMDDSNLYRSEPNNLAYVIYTSGTTGMPKGVLLEHRGLINLVANQKKMMRLNSLSRVLQFATFNFDSSVIEIFSSLLFGAALHISTDKDNHFDLEKLIAQIKEENITHIILPPVVLKELPIQELKSLEVVGSAGSECPVELISKYRDVVFFNGYGPSEYTVCTSYKSFEKGEELLEESAVPIGKPITNTSVLILDENNKLVPIGVAGELHVGGIGIARGYLNMPALTAEKFIINPYNVAQKIYKTGDMVKFNHRGELIYVGRKDDQFKIRGYRVELSEVEGAIRKLNEVQGCFVSVIENQSGHKQIIAFYKLDQKISALELRSKIKELLPHFMVPSYLVEVDEFPLNTNGKVDKKILLEHFEKMEANKNKEHTEEPLSQIELAVLTIWRNCLNDSSIGPDDNFFDFGGDSIISIQVCSAAKEQNIYFTPKDLFEYQTVRELAKIVKHLSPTITEQNTVEGEVSLTPIQQWFFKENHHNINYWNQSIVLIEEPLFSLAQYQMLINQLVDHHDGLKTVFKQIKNNIVGEVQTTHPACTFEEHVVMDFTNEQTMQHIDKVEAKAQQSLNIYTGPLMKFVVFRSGKQVRIFWVIHHLLVDGVSWRILLEDFEKGKQQILQNEPLSFPTKTTSYQKWGELLKQYAEKEISNEIMHYWEKELKQPVPTYSQKLSEITQGTDIYQFKYNQTCTEHLIKNITKKYKTTVDEVLLSIIAHVISKQWDVSELWIDLEGHGREDIMDNVDIMRTVGWFTTMYPVRLNGSETMDNVLRNTKQRLRSVPNKGFDYSVLKYLSEQSMPIIKSYISYNNLGQFNVQNDSMQTSSNNIDPQYVFPYKLNFTVSIINGELNMMLIADAKNSKIQKVAEAINTNLENLFIDDSILEKSIRVEDFNEAALVDEETVTYFLNKYHNIEEIYPVTLLQEGMLFHSEKNKGTEYISQLVFDLKGNLDVEKLEIAWNKVCQKYGVLRSVFKRNIWGDQFQIVLNDVYYQFNQIDLSASNKLEQEINLKHLANNARENSIDLENGPIMNIMLVKLSECQYQFIWTHHHVILDGWSLQIVMHQFMNNYHNPMTNDNDEKERVAYHEIMQHLLTNKPNNESEFWSQQLQHINQLIIPSKNQQVERHAAVDNILEFSLSEELTKQLIDLSKKYRNTMNSVVQAIWSLAQTALTGNKYICYGVTSSGRNVSIPNIDSVVGLFINTLPFLIEIDEEMNLSELLQMIQTKQLELREYEYSTLADIKRFAKVPWNQELFNQIYVYENYPSREMANDKEIVIENSIGIESTNFDLTFSAALFDSKLHCKFIYKDHFMSETEILQYQKAICQVTQSIVQDDNDSLKTIIENFKVEV